MNLKEIKEMINLMNESGLSELELERDGLRIKLRKGSAPEVSMGLAPLPPGGTLSAGAQAGEPSQPEAEEGVLEVKAPMVGTFYRAPAPDAPPYAEEGQRIEKGQVLCIIEAMKLMNEIKSELSGTIKDILVRNGDPVEFDQTLFRIKT
ncbi:MAG: acetyl-CoA carboxylase biotin carboxyl carrier protein [Candidatus Omnitrophica bacterium]|nr:acetyl-CoA carboxylase biotin carboxyl carrier protein [Candidatus Omnitrophota bacterium]